MQNTGPERNMNTLYFFFGNTRKRRRVHLTQTLSRDGNKQKEETSETSSEYHQKIRLFHQQRTERPFKEHDHH